MIPPNWTAFLSHSSKAKQRSRVPPLSSRASRSKEWVRVCGVSWDGLIHIPMLHNAGSIEAVNIHACNRRTGGELNTSMNQSKVSVNQRTQDFDRRNLKERLLLKEGVGGISTVQNIGIVLNVFDGYMIGQCFGSVSMIVELLKKFGEEVALCC